jgi:DNA-binding response OmpR family regulator
MDESPLRTGIYSPLQILVFSDDAGTRRQIELALGRLPDARLGALNFRAVATQPAVLHEISCGTVDLLILDAEAAPFGGMGVAKQIKDELLQCLPIVVVISRAADRWLASWSRADAVVMSPVNPGELKDAVLPLLRNRH